VFVEKMRITVGYVPVENAAENGRCNPINAAENGAS